MAKIRRSSSITRNPWVGRSFDGAMPTGACRSMDASVGASEATALM